MSIITDAFTHAKSLTHAVNLTLKGSLSTESGDFDGIWF